MPDRYGNVGGANAGSFATDMRREMRLYDSFPKRLREAIGSSNLKYAVGFVAQMIDEGCSEDKIIQALKLSDLKAAEALARKEGLASPPPYKERPE